MKKETTTKTATTKKATTKTTAVKTATKKATTENKTATTVKTDSNKEKFTSADNLNKLNETAYKNYKMSVDFNRESVLQIHLDNSKTAVFKLYFKKLLIFRLDYSIARMLVDSLKDTTDYTVYNHYTDYLNKTACKDKYIEVRTTYDKFDVVMKQLCDLHNKACVQSTTTVTKKADVKKA